MKSIIITALLAVFALTGCEPFTGTGKVIAKDYDPPSHYQTCTAYIPVRIGNITTMQCIAYGYQLTDPSWKLKLSSLPPAEPKVGWVEVSEARYEECNAGQHYDTETDVCKSA